MKVHHAILDGTDPIRWLLFPWVRNESCRSWHRFLFSAAFLLSVSWTNRTMHWCHLGLEVGIAMDPRELHETRDGALELRRDDCQTDVVDGA
jgi:hypothetical protein